MKTSFIKSTIMVVVISLCQIYTGMATNTAPADTIKIDFGNQSKIVIYLDDTSDMEVLSNYDINKMIKELSLKIKDSNNNVDYLKIEDTKGDIFLQDTTLVAEEQSELAITKNEDEAKVEEKEESSKNTFTFEIPAFQNSKERKNKNSINVELGLNNYSKYGELSSSNSEKYAVKPFGSWYVGVTSKHKSLISGPLFLEWGGGISWYNFKMDDPQVAIIKGENAIEFQRLTNNIYGKKSKITASFINISVVPVLDFSKGKEKETNASEHEAKASKYKQKGFRFGIGPYVGYRIGSHTKFKYETEEGTKIDKDKGGFYLNNFRYGVRFQIGYKGLDLFANYDLNPLFEKDHGPKLNAFSFGIVI